MADQDEQQQQLPPQEAQFVTVVTPAASMARAVSAPGESDLGIEDASAAGFFSELQTQQQQQEQQQKDDLSPYNDAPVSREPAPSVWIDAESLPAPPPPPGGAGQGHAHLRAPSGSLPPEPQTPNEFNTQNAANDLLGPPQGAGAGERRNSRPNLRLQSQAPPKLSTTAALAVPITGGMPPSSSSSDSSLFSLPPASPTTPACFVAPPPNTPMSSSVLMARNGSTGGLEPVSPGPSPMFDQPFTPLPIPMSPMYPQPPPPSPFPAKSPSNDGTAGAAAGAGTAAGAPPKRTHQRNESNTSGAGSSGGTSAQMSPFGSPSASPHPVRLIMQLPAVMSGVDVLSPKPAAAVDDHDDAAPLEPIPIQEGTPGPGPTAAQVAQQTQEEYDEQIAAIPISLDAAAAQFEDELDGLDGMPSPRDGSNVLEVRVSIDEGRPGQGGNGAGGAGGDASGSNDGSTLVGSASFDDQSLLLHRSRLGRLSIIQRDEVPTGVLPEPPSSSSSSSSSSSAAQPPPPTSSSPPAASVAASSPAGAAAAAAASSAPPNYGRTASMPTNVGRPGSSGGVKPLPPAKGGKGAAGGDIVVTSVKRVQHVTFNPNNPNVDFAAQLASIPDEWKEALKQQFGLPPNLQPSVKLSYASRIPTVLVKMHDYLRVSHTFENQVGIFRLAPDSAECARLKTALNADVTAVENAKAGAYNDMGACCANLIKVWFRDLPAALFHAMPLDKLSGLNSQTPDATLEALIASSLKEPQQSIYRWLLDLCCDVTQHSETNKMIAKNMAICIGPNLYKPPSVGGKGAPSPADAMKIIQQCKHYTTFLELCIGMREAQRGQKRTSLV